jgi:hypothetical protein
MVNGIQFIIYNSPLFIHHFSFILKPRDLPLAIDDGLPDL